MEIAMQLTGPDDAIERARFAIGEFQDRSRYWVLYAEQRMTFKDEAARAKFVALLKETIASVGKNDAAQFWLDHEEDIEKVVAKDLADRFDTTERAAIWLAAKFMQALDDPHVRALLEAREGEAEQQAG